MYNLITSTGELKDLEHAGAFPFPISCLGTGLGAKLLLRLKRVPVEVVKKQELWNQKKSSDAGGR